MSDVGQRSLSPQQGPAFVTEPYPRANGLAIVAFVLSFFVGVAGVVLGYVALAQIRRTGEDGRGLALAAVVLGWVSVVVTVLAIAALVIGSVVLKLF